jgi:hypothetical protein
VPDEIVKLSNPVDEKVIDSCLELLAAGPTLGRRGAYMRVLSRLAIRRRRCTSVRHTTPRSSNERVLEGAHADISIPRSFGTVALAILGQRKPRKC